MEDEYMYGPDILVAPILHAGQRSREVYLPAGESWIEHATGKTYTGGTTVLAAAELDTIPVFLRENSIVADSLLEK